MTEETDDSAPLISQIRDPLELSELYQMNALKLLYDPAKCRLKAKSALSRP
jgi:hypothetical protein